MGFLLEPPDRPTLDVGVYAGTVTRGGTSSVWVQIPDLVPGYEYGPCKVPSDWRTWTHVGHGAMSEDTEPEHQLQYPVGSGTKVTVLLTGSEHYLLARYRD